MSMAKPYIRVLIEIGKDSVTMDFEGYGKLEIPKEPEDKHDREFLAELLTSIEWFLESNFYSTNPKYIKE